jgi:hypothetical protein
VFKETPMLLNGNNFFVNNNLNENNVSKSRKLPNSKLKLTL